MSETNTGFWTTYPLAVGTAGLWRLGPLRFWVRHLPQEWRVMAEQGDDALDDEVSVELPTDFEFTAGEPRRFASRHAGGRLRIAPRLADRPVVVRPEAPFTLLPDDEVVIYVGSPVWVTLAVEEGQELCEFPATRPKDSWLGTPIAGERCYASRTRARLNFENVQPVPARAITAMHVRNRSTRPLLLERVALRAPELGIFADASGGLWTETVTVERREEAAVEVRVERSAPPEAGAVERVGEPRVRTDRNVFVRALGALFG